MISDVTRLDDINEQLIEQLRSYSVAAEDAGCLTPEQLDIIYAKRWFNLFVPIVLGGLGLSLPQGVALEETLAYIDGSLGWTITLCAGASQFVGYLQPVAASEIFNDNKVCFAGSGLTGTAVITDDGYIVNGYWQWATGAPHATVFTANCFMEQNGSRLKNADGTDRIQSFFFLRSEVKITENWDMMGLKATAGHSFTVSDLLVNNERTFIIDGAFATLSDPIYHYPFLQFAETTIAANTSGMALHFLSLCRELLDRKTAKTGAVNTTRFKSMLDAADDRLNILRDAFYAALNASWTSQSSSSEEELRLVSECSRALANGARIIVQELYPHCGMEGAKTTSTINRVWRDMHTASQHSLLRV